MDSTETAPGVGAAERAAGIDAAAVGDAPAPADAVAADVPAVAGIDADGAPRTGRGISRLLTMPAEVRDAGMATAEYAIVTVAAAGFAGLLIAILRSDEVRSTLLGIVRGALAV
jgi:hypothetical protein